MTRAVLSLGSNLGDRLGELRRAVAALRDVLVLTSGVYETPPWGIPTSPRTSTRWCWWSTRRPGRGTG
ncbi:hypothetical protein GCM10027605_04970 [Micromonospora zhanjiangensis]